MYIKIVGHGQEGFIHVEHKIIIRSETYADVSTIAKVTVAAFKTLAISNHTEHFIVAALRAAKALKVSLVAELDGRVVGHIAFSPVTISDGTQNWYGLGSVSVLPGYQRQGIGKALIQKGLSRLKDLSAQGCCVVGHPDYYRKFGFKNISGFMHEGGCHRRSSSLCLSMDILRRVPPCSTKDSKRMAKYAYDTCYLQCCIENKLSLIGLDDRMCDIARNLGIKVVE